MTKMKTTIELAKECGFNIDGEVISVAPSQYYSISNSDIRKKLEAFRKAVEANFVSRCTFEGYKNSDNTPIYTLPKETK